MSGAELARRMGVSRFYLNAVADGRKNVTLSQLERIAEALGMALHVCFEE